MLRDNNKGHNKEQDYENKDVFAIIVVKLKKYIYKRNYLLTSKSNFNFLYASFIHIVFYLQLFLLYSLPTYNTAVQQGSDMYKIVSKMIGLLLKFNVSTQLDLNKMTIMILTVIQIILLIVYFLPIKSKQANLFLSKYFIQIFSTIIYIPSIFISTQNILNSNALYFSFPNLLLTLINRLIYITMHFQFSIQGQGNNSLIRNPLSTSKEIIQFILVVVFLLCKSYVYPMSLLAYLIVNIIFCLLQVKQYCIGFNYHIEGMTKLVGILNIMKISMFLCYIIVLATQITLVKDNITTFIITFFIFFANFFLVFKKHTTKSIVIDSQGNTETKMIIFIMWYFNCFRNRSQKKNQLYLSSLLKNHSSQCTQLACCCQKRDSIYDPSLNIFGSPSSQPHQDIVYIKHFFLKLLIQTYKNFPKSNQILFLLAFYYLEILNFIPQTIELIKQLKKKSLKKNLTFSQDYVLYCLGERCYQKIRQINHVKGNLDLEKARDFDLKILEIKDTIKFSVETFSSLWKTICSQKYNQKNLVQICKIALQIMFKIQQIYKQIKKLNNVSTQLKQIMTLYSKSVAHDVHLLSQIKKQIKLNGQKSNILNSIQIKGINIFSPDTITLITSQISNIRWASKNCYNIFGYGSREQFLKLKINDLMPKYFSQNHDNYISKWLQTGFSSKINKSTYLWCSTKDGYCFSVGIYIKIIPLQKQQDFAFFVAIQKIDIDNQIICNQQGEILGCGKVFASTIKCSQKLLQDYRPNIQILIPSTFDIFLQNFYFEKKTTSFQMMTDVRRQGYFPKNIDAILKQLCKQKLTFLNNNNRKSNIKQLYCNFLKQKMQQITVYIDGQYISFITILHEVQTLQNKKRKIFLFKITGFKKNNVEKYYNDLEKMISKLQSIKKQVKHQKKKKNTHFNNSKSLKKDYFKVFLNPKRVKKILQQQDDQKNFNITQQFQRLDAIDDFQQQKIRNFKQRVQRDSLMVNQQKIIDYRKKLALNAQFQIKNQRAKYNIWKMKKLLFQEGILSRYTYNMLVGKGNDFESCKNFGKTQDFKTTNQFLVTDAHLQHRQQQNHQLSEDELLSQDLSNQPQIQNADKPNDNQTFNSASSSAAFISMTNSIKMFKIKLRSLNTPKLLYWLNVILILVILLIAAFGIWLWAAQNTNLKLGYIYFEKAVQSTWAIDSLLMGKLATIKQIQLQQYKSYFNSSFYQENMPYLKSKQFQYLDICHQILSLQLLQYAQLQKQDASLLQYIFKRIPLIQTFDSFSSIQYLSTLQFIMRQQDYSKQNLNIRNQKQISYLLSVHKQTFGKNIYYLQLKKIDLILFLCGLIIFLVMLFITIPIVYKIESKVEEIMELVGKISLNQRRRYFLQFNILNQELQNLKETDSWAEIEQMQQNKMRRVNLKNTFSQMSSQFNVSKNSTMDINKPQSNKKTQQVTYQNRKLNTKLNQTIYFKIVVIYTIFLVVYVAKFIDLKIKFNGFLVQNQVFTNILQQKLATTQESLIFNQYLTDKAVPNIKINLSRLVQQIYLSYHLDLTEGSYYNNFVQQITTANVCQKINQQLYKIHDQTVYLKIFKLNSTQMNICQGIQNGTLMRGLFSSIDYMHQRRQYMIDRPLNQRLAYAQSALTFNVYKLLYYTNSISYIMQRLLKTQVNTVKQNLVFNMGAWLIVLAVFLLVFTFVWVFIYLNIAQKASYINAFLLLIPYDVLSENPYIKLYIKNQFDYKSSVY